MAADPGPFAARASPKDGAAIRMTPSTILSAPEPAAPVLPKRADVVIIGGGIIGVSAAWSLARRGVSVALCEKSRVAAEQSSRNWGFVRQQGRDPAELPLIIESLRIWRGLEAEIGRTVGFRQAGVLYMADDETDIARFEAFLELARQYQLDTRLLNRAEILERLPGTTGTWEAALTTPSDARAEPGLAAPAIAAAAREHGAHVLERCAVRGLETSAGRVSGVVTEHGTIATDAVLLSAGAWSRLFCQRHGITLPQLMVKGQVMRTGPAPLITDSAVWSRKVAFRRRADGGYSVAHGGANIASITPDSLRFLPLFWESFKSERRRLRVRLDERFWGELTRPIRWSMANPGPFEESRTLDPVPNATILGEAEASLRRLFPQLRDVKIVERWGGMIDVTPDAVPVIAPVAALPGFYLATGFSGHGFGIGPGAGRLAADIVTGAPPIVDPVPFRLERFWQ
jgi:glycine/D-amino acid oxidase-like deaminating enzyme